MQFARSCSPRTRRHRRLPRKQFSSNFKSRWQCECDDDGEESFFVTFICVIAVGAHRPSLFDGNQQRWSDQPHSDQKRGEASHQGSKGTYGQLLLHQQIRHFASSGRRSPERVESEKSRWRQRKSLIESTLIGINYHSPQLPAITLSI